VQGNLCHLPTAPPRLVGIGMIRAPVGLSMSKRHPLGTAHIALGSQASSAAVKVDARR
jgi:hypothetical protein